MASSALAPERAGGASAPAVIGECLRPGPVRRGDTQGCESQPRNSRPSSATCSNDPIPGVALSRARS